MMKNSTTFKRIAFLVAFGVLAAQTPVQAYWGEELITRIVAWFKSLRHKHKPVTQAIPARPASANINNPAAQQQQAPPRQQPLVKQWTCKWCLKDNSADKETCWNCSFDKGTGPKSEGVTIAPTPVIVPTAVAIKAAEAPAKVKVCPTCRFKNEPARTQCELCETSL